MLQTRSLRDQVSLTRSRHEWITIRDNAWTWLGADVRKIIRAGGVPDYPDRPQIMKHYAEWLEACATIGPLQGTPAVQRKNLYTKRSEIRKRLPLHLRSATPDELQAAGRLTEAEGLLDVEWRLSLLRTGRTQEKEHWSKCEDRFRLKRRLRRYELRVLEYGGTCSADPRMPQLLADIDGMKERLKRLEWDEYEARLREWEANAPAHELLPPVKRRTLTAAERRLRVGGRRGPPPGWAAPGSSKPRRPGWLKAQDEEDRRAERNVLRVKPLPADDWHEKELKRQEAAAKRKRAREANRREDSIAHQCQVLLEWAWGEGRVYGLGLDLGNGWIFYVPGDVPYEAVRQAALEWCAVRVSDGWCFPPAGQFAGA